MSYNKIVSVTGLGGLFELISSKSDGGIVRSLEDKSTKFISNRVHTFSQLESIEIFTMKDNVNLVEIFEAMKKSTEPIPDGSADNKMIRKYFEKVYPDMDFEKVYASDMKKMIKWLEILTRNNIEIKLSEAEDEFGDQVAGKKNTANKALNPKAAALKNAPAKKINTPRKMV